MFQRKEEINNVGRYVNICLDRASSDILVYCKDMGSGIFDIFPFPYWNVCKYGFM